MLDFSQFLGLLVVVALLASIGHRFSVPYPIVFVLGGLALAVIPGMPGIALNPDLVLVIFLPPLIYAAAQETSLVEVKQNVRPILRLAVGLVLATMVAVAVVAHLLAPGLPWAAAFTLGAIISPPDAVAATAIASALGLPRGLVVILEGEGLFNDATALVAFKITSGIVITGAALDPASTVLRFIYAAIAGVGIGLVVGWVGRAILRRANEAAVENTVVLLLPFAAYLPADAGGASGVLAVLAMALYLSQFSGEILSPIGRLRNRTLWDMINFLLTGLSFILVGLELSAIQVGAGRWSTTDAVVGALVVSATVILVRPVWVFGTHLLSRGHYAWDVEADKASHRELAVISWAGMRGVVSLAVALSLPTTIDGGGPFPGRDIIVFIAFVVILVTLIGQGLTLPAVIRRMGIQSAARDAEDQELSARLSMLHAGLDRLDTLGPALGCSDELVAQVRETYAQRIGRLEERRAALTSDDETERQKQEQAARLRAANRRLAATMLDAEQSALNRLRISAAIDADLAQRLQRDLDVRRLEFER
jgi:CPA1 family monovalent cation:H+ antiporter